MKTRITHHIQIQRSFNVWSPKQMILHIKMRTPLYVKNYNIYIAEWFLHNIGYYVTLPFIKNEYIKHINIRCRDVDLIIKEYV